MRRHANTAQPHQAQRTMLLRPPERTRMQKLGDVFWNSREGTCLTRTPVNWLAIGLYYTLFLAGVILLFYVSMMVAEAVASRNARRPQYMLGDSPIGGSPGLNFFPLIDSRNLIWLSSNRPYSQYVDVIKDEFESYKRKSKVFNTSKFAECGDPPFGYNNKTPCLFFRLNRILQWVPTPFRKGDKFPREMPEELKEQIKNSTTPKIWFTCNGTTAKDRDHITQDFFKFQGGNGFDVSNYPFKAQDDFVDPIVAVKFTDTKQKRVLYSFTCTAWGNHLDRSRSKVDVTYYFE